MLLRCLGLGLAAELAGQGDELVDDGEGQHDADPDRQQEEGGYEERHKCGAARHRELLVVLESQGISQKTPRHRKGKGGCLCLLIRAYLDQGVRLCVCRIICQRRP